MPQIYIHYYHPGIQNIQLYLQFSALNHTLISYFYDKMLPTSPMKLKKGSMTSHTRIQGYQMMRFYKLAVGGA